VSRIWKKNSSFRSQNENLPCKSDNIAGRTDLDPVFKHDYRVCMSAKELAKDVLNRLPDNVTMHELTEELYAAAVREGLEELDRGAGILHEDVKREFSSWFPK
jgi:hypothetical protein